MNPNNQQQPTQPVQAEPQMQVPSQPMPTVQQPIVQAAAPVPPTAPKSNKKPLLVLLVVLILLLILGGVVYFYLMGNKNNSNTNISAQEGPPTQEQVKITPTPEVSVNDSTQLDSAINEVNGTSTTTMESEYNQAVIEAKSL